MPAGDAPLAGAGGDEERRSSALVDDPKVEAFAALFAGRTDARGTYEGLCVRGAVTRHDYRRHLEGDVSLGVYPLLDEGLCWWATADLDTAPKGQGTTESDARAVTGARRLREALGKLGVRSGLWLERSGSRGAHLWWLFDRLVPAYDARRVLFAAAGQAGVKVEVFPKQDRLTGGDALGNYVNLPYFMGRDDSRQRMLDWATGEVLRLEAFMARADRFAGDELPLCLEETPAPPKSTRVSLGRAGLGGGPTPCFHAMLASGASEGLRNNTCAALAMHMNRQGMTQSQAEGQLLGWNSRNAPPLPEREIAATVRSVFGRGYRSLWCEHPAVAQHCSPACPVYQKATAARGEDARPETVAAPATGDEEEVRMEGLTIIADDPRRYLVRVNGRQIVGVPTTELLSFARFKVRCAEAGGFIPRLPAVRGQSRQEQWELLLGPLLASAIQEEIPEDTTETGRLREMVSRYLTEKTRQTTRRADLLRGRVLAEGDYLYFRGVDLIQYLGEQGFDRRELGAELRTRVLRDAGAVRWVVRIDPHTTLKVQRFPLSAVNGHDPEGQLPLTESVTEVTDRDAEKL
jgi:hypothetical protein